MVDARIPCMTTAFDDTGQHPVTSTIAAITQQLHEVADLGLWTLRPAETETNLTALAQLRHQITELELRHAHHADRLDLGAQARCRRHRRLVGQPDPADQTGRQTSSRSRQRAGL